MKTLIVPVDFSQASINAANYALDFAAAIDGSIALINICQFPVAFSEVPVPAITITELIKDAEVNIAELKADLLRKAKGDIKIYTEVKEGGIITEIENYANTLHPYAVVMGARGAGGFETTLFGSNTVSAMKHLTWPLIIVPKGAHFTSIKKIGLACDLRNVTQSVHAAQLNQLVSDFHAELDVLHVQKEKTGSLSGEEVEGSEWLREMLEEVKPTFHFMTKNNIDEAINEFAETNNLDMLVMIPKKHGLLDGIFHSSHSKSLAMHAHVPVMSIHE